MNHFETLGLAAEFSLDVSSLSVTYRELQRQYHPDKFVTASEQQQRIALQKSAQINDAYQTLINPISRAEHLLALHGVELKDEQQSMKDMEFLMQQMALREALEDIAASQDENKLEDFSDEVASLFNTRLTELTSLLANETWLQAADCVRKMKFLAKLQQEIERIEDRMF